MDTRWLLIAVIAAGCGQGPVNVGERRDVAQPDQSAAGVVTDRTETPSETNPSANSFTPTRREDAERAFTQLIRAAKAGDPDVWSAAERDLQQLGVDALPALIPALHSAESMEREMAVMFLAQLGPQAAPAAEDLKPLLSDSSAMVRVNAAAVLSSLEQPVPEAIKSLTALLDNEDVNIRLTAIASLGNAGELAESAVSRLEKCLTDGDAKVRSAAAVAVGQLGPSAKTVLPTLKLLSSDDDPNVRDAVTQAVQKITSE